jgi:hypothetical protein
MFNAVRSGVIIAAVLAALLSSGAAILFHQAGELTSSAFRVCR